MLDLRLTRRSFLGTTALVGAATLAACGGSDEATETATYETTEETTEESTEAGAANVVETAYGPVTGVAADGVVTWYAVPYGANPTGDLRWQAPTAPDPWTEALDCTEPGEMALQLADGEAAGTEDILNLDIYAPEGAEGLPVLVFIHGGNNQTGNAQEIPGFDIVKRDECVYVSLSFRLGLLGFMPLPAVTAKSDDTGNYAMLDIAAALDWIADNIAAFGGDPANITVSGFSAGGRDVMAMLVSPTFAGKFQKAIAFSGGMTTAEVDPSINKFAAAIAPLAVEDGKAETEKEAYDWLKGTDDEVYEYLMGIDAARLAALMGNAGIRMSVFPHLFQDGSVLPGDGFEGATYTSVPLIMLTGATEFSFFCLFDGFFSSDAVADLSEEEIEAAKTFGNVHGSEMYRIFNAQDSAERMFDSYDSNIYVCQVDFGAAYSPSADALIPYGSFHGVFVPMLSTKNNYAGMIEGVFDGAGYQEMAAAFNAYLKAFLASPDGSMAVDGQIEWEPWTPENKVSLVLDADGEKATIEMQDVTGSYDDVIAAMKVDGTCSDEIKTLVEHNVTNGRWFSAAQDAAFGAPDLWEVSFE